jgi:hypothetical protein
MFRCFTPALLTTFILLTGSARAAEPIAPNVTTLNGLTIALDPTSGAILRLAYDGPGQMLDSKPNRAGVLDVAYPVEQFEPLRLAARYSTGARIKRDGDTLTVSWDALGASRSKFAPQGNVAATVQFKAAPDGKSVILTAHIDNHAARSVRQVLFPDFSGLKPFAGVEHTLFRTGGSVSAPFVELAPNEDKLSQQYMTDAASLSASYQAGGLFHPMVVRWMDFGGLAGGFSLFPKRWGWEKQVVTRLQLSEVEQSLRLMCIHDVEIKPNQSWDSGEFVLTPHPGGWAKGIEPYRAWVKQHFKREFPLPKHVREGLGYRTAWMCQNQPNDPQDAVFTFEDLPKLAKECKEHGIDELALWAWNKGFVLPLPPPYPHLGTPQEMADAVAECRKLGVNVTPFISVLQANAETAPRYGLKVTDNNGWTFHTELVPRWNPPYATGFAGVGVPTSNELWRKDVVAGVSHLVDSGITSLGWDQYWATEQPPNIQTLASQFRAIARAKDPESVFMGEELWNMEVDSAMLDYTWNWGTYRDVRPLTSCFPAPRVNCIITASALNAKKAFADNLYLNLFPRKAESINGSDYLANWPELSRAVKQCAALRKQFLPYFTDGTLIGECVLTAPAPGVHVSAYVLPDRVLVIVINQSGAETAFTLKADVRPWLTSPSGNYQVKTFDEDAKLLSTKAMAAAPAGDTPKLKPAQMVVYEFTP